MRYLRRALVGTTSLAMATALAACGQTDGGSGSGKTIGLLLPENATARYEAFDRPAMEAKVKELCPECGFEYANAEDDATTQKQQFDAMLDKGVDVLVLDPVDATATAPWVKQAKERGVPVVAYDRLAQGDIVAYVSYDNFRVGHLQGRAVLDALDGETATPRVVMINGSPSDPNSADFKAGAHEALDKEVEVVFEEDIDGWDPKLAGENMADAIKSLGPSGFDAVYSANDGMAAGVIAALDNADVSGKPVGGQDAELAGLQRIVAGEQAFTVYKPLVPLAETTAEIAVRLTNDKFFQILTPHLVNSPTNTNIPAAQLEPVTVTGANIRDTVVEDGVYSVQQICTKDYRKDCAELGLVAD
ncbi:substrate-binding domain-containing protein [Streptomyces sp. 549]|uniref:sugar ABC transporter substrate-binding protein n=1 Tax=Streptomyces sp. 549 TaxID=3049076 RepID=UPI0024C2C90E|nr:substrate-binding domain-containing protein [Streptomyces sp. 549]MDK1474666.1 substrate-binding domain-containing protein [Streptomyces sp. 549]